MKSSNFYVCGLVLLVLVSIASCIGQEPPFTGKPMSGLWSNGEIQFNVAEDGKMITARNSPLGASLIIKVRLSEQGCSRASSTTISVFADIPIENQSFRHSSVSGLTVEGTFVSETVCKGTYSFEREDFSPGCSKYFRGSGSWKAWHR